MYGRPNHFPSRVAGRPHRPTAAPPPGRPTAPSVNGIVTFENPNIFSQTVPPSPYAPFPRFHNQPVQQQTYAPPPPPIWPFPQNHASPVQNIGVFPPQQLPHSSVQTPTCSSQNPKELTEKIDRAVSKARDDLLAAGDSVTSWNVSQKSLLMLQLDSWNSLGIKMQQVPSLHRLMSIEGKVVSLFFSSAISSENFLNLIFLMLYLIH